MVTENTEESVIVAALPHQAERYNTLGPAVLLRLLFYESVDAVASPTP